MRSLSALLLTTLLTACGQGAKDDQRGVDSVPSESSADTEATEPPTDDDTEDNTASDSAVEPTDTTIDTAIDTDSAAPFEPGAAPTAPLLPEAGELYIEQVRLPFLPGLDLGEAAIVIGPDGTTVLLDIGNTSHDDNLRDALSPLSPDLSVDWVVLTHHHQDHMGSLEDLLLTASQTVTVTQGIVHRGFVELGGGMSTDDYERFCDAVRGPLAAVDVPLCESAAPAPCDEDATDYPAIACDGLRLGELGSSDDDGADVDTFIDLGDGARLTLIAASGWASGDDGLVPLAPGANEHGDVENALSLVGVITYGDFVYTFGGDLNGPGGADGPDMEGHVVATSGARVLGSLGADVVHAHHHARETSNGPAFVDWAAPDDGLTRSVIAGINEGYIGSPQGAVLDAFLLDDRLAGGRFWITESASGALPDDVVNADGDIIIRTVQSGRGYWIQARESLEAQSIEAVRAR